MTAAAVRRVGIHLRAFPIASEAFVVEQARALRSFRPEFLVRELLRLDSGMSVRAIDPHWRRRLFALAPGAWAYGGREELNGLDLMHAHFGPNGVYALPISKALGIPLVVTFHGFDVTSDLKLLARDGGLFGARYVRGLPRLRNQGSRFIAVSKFIQGRLEGMQFPLNRIRQHYIGVDLSRFSPTQLEDRTLDVVCVGRLVAAKGIGELIRAFAKVANRFPESRLRLIGEGRERPVFQAMATELGLDTRIRFEGTMPHAQVADVVRHSAVAVLVSKTGIDGSQEAFGLAAIEASACGIPIIVSRHGGLPETVDDGESGLVVPEASVDALADALNQLLSSGAMREKMGIAGRAKTERSFDLYKQTEKLEEIYHEALQNDD